MSSDVQPLQIFATHRRLSRRGEGPRDISVFAGERLLYASYAGGDEQVLDVRAHARVELLVIYLDWAMAHAREASERHPRAPEEPPRQTASASPDRRAGGSAGEQGDQMRIPPSTSMQRPVK